MAHKKDKAVHATVATASANVSALKPTAVNSSAPAASSSATRRALRRGSNVGAARLDFVCPCRGKVRFGQQGQRVNIDPVASTS